MLRGLVVATGLVVLYYLLPLDRPLDAGAAVGLLIGLLVFTGITVWQVRAIAGSRYPGLRAAEALGFIIPLYLLLFTSTYFLMERASAANFTQPLTRTDALYFRVTVFTTVGFGDIAAKSETARVVLIVQMLADLAVPTPARGCCWGRCTAASNEDPIQATATARKPSDPLSSPQHLASSPCGASGFAGDSGRCGYESRVIACDAHHASLAQRRHRKRTSTRRQPRAEAVAESVSVAGGCPPR